MSVSNKEGLIPFCEWLNASGLEVVASGGTAAALRNHDISVRDVCDLSGHPEMLAGRVKTLHPAVHAGILAGNSAADAADMSRMRYDYIRMVVCNLYPFQDVVSRQNVTLADAVENIDIGRISINSIKLITSSHLVNLMQGA